MTINIYFFFSPTVTSTENQSDISVDDSALVDPIKSLSPQPGCSLWDDNNIEKEDLYIESPKRLVRII